MKAAEVNLPPGALGPRVQVFHAGALGDHIMIWPFLRALARAGASVGVSAAPSHAELTTREMAKQIGGGKSGGVWGGPADQPPYARFWAGPEALEWHEIEDGGTTGVVTFVASPDDQAGARWHAAARAYFNMVGHILYAGRPDTDAAGRAALWKLADVERWGGVEPRVNPFGSVVLYVGAGGAAKRWAQERWAALARAVRASAALGRPRVLLLVGANEIEGRDDLDDLPGAAGEDDGVRLKRCQDPSRLAAYIRRARAYVGVDTGPTHLAAQLGVPTLALFGPTDPAVWGPVGPLASVVRSPDGTMGGFEVERVLQELHGLVARAEGGAGSGGTG